MAASAAPWSCRGFTWGPPYLGGVVVVVVVVGEVVVVVGGFLVVVAGPVVVGAVVVVVVVLVVVFGGGALGVAVIGFLLTAGRVVVCRDVLAEVSCACVVAAAGGGEELVAMIGAAVAGGGPVWVLMCRVGVGGVVGGAVGAGRLLGLVGWVVAERRLSATPPPAASASTAAPAGNAIVRWRAPGRRRRW